MKITYYVGGMFFVLCNSIAQNDFGTKVKEQAKSSSENRTLKDDDRYFMANLKLAVGTPDTRHKLIETGEFSTTGIKFDSGSDKIKPESYGTLKEIAQVLKEFPDVKIKIIGHTDTDGTPEKNTLVKEFGIDASKMETDGKANNRRVEFVKL